MKLEIELSQWHVIKSALESDIEDFKKTAELPTTSELSNKLLMEAAERREQVLKELLEQVKDYE